MRTVEELHAVVLEASREIQEGIVRAGEAYHKLIPAIREFGQEAYRTGGEGSVDDLVAHAGAERIRTDIIGLMIAAGLREVLVASQGRTDYAPLPDFAGRIESVVNAGHLTATRGPQDPDPLSAYMYPGAKVHKR
jgi:hypothetical protein